MTVRCEWLGEQGEETNTIRVWAGPGKTGHEGNMFDNHLFFRDTLLTHGYGVGYRPDHAIVDTVHEFDLGGIPVSDHDFYFIVMSPYGYGHTAYGDSPYINYYTPGCEKISGSYKYDGTTSYLFEDGGGPPKEDTYIEWKYI
jgi:hypothetical protein